MIAGPHRILELELYVVVFALEVVVVVLESVVLVVTCDVSAPDASECWAMGDVLVVRRRTGVVDIVLVSVLVFVEVVSLADVVWPDGSV